MFTELKLFFAENKLYRLDRWPFWEKGNKPTVKTLKRIVCWFKHQSLFAKTFKFALAAICLPPLKVQPLAALKHCPLWSLCFAAARSTSQCWKYNVFRSFIRPQCFAWCIESLFYFFMFLFSPTPTLLVSAGEWMFMLLGFFFPYIFFAFFSVCVFSGLCNKRWRDFPKASRPVGRSLPLCGAHEHTHAF